MWKHCHKSANCMSLKLSESNSNNYWTIAISTIVSQISFCCLLFILLPLSLLSLCVFCNSLSISDWDFSEGLWKSFLRIFLWLKLISDNVISTNERMEASLSLEISFDGNESQKRHWKHWTPFVICCCHLKIK